MARSHLNVLKQVATDALAGALDTLEARVLQARAEPSRAGGAHQLDRLREVLERDRALATAGLPQPAPRPLPARVELPVPPSAAAPAAIACDEPIRTRSMAKLLAAQGHPERALSIYAYLLAHDPGNAVVQAEYAALRGAEQQAADR
jgi:hypothetical protein